MITEIAQSAATDAAQHLQNALDALQDAEIELEDTLEQYDNAPLDPDEEEGRDLGQIVADLLWDTRELYNEIEAIAARVSDYSDAVEKATT